MRTRTFSDAPGTSRAVIAALIAACWMGFAPAAPLRGAPARVRLETRSTEGIASFDWQGTSKQLDRREGWIPAATVPLEEAVAVLWVRGDTGREGTVRVYRLPSAERIWESPVFARPALEAGSSPKRFLVATPLDELELPAPHLRVKQEFRWNGDDVRLKARVKNQPATPAQKLEWANDEFVSGAADTALEALDGWDRVHGTDPEMKSERAIALDLRARCQQQLGRGKDLLMTLRRTARECAGEPAAAAAEEALSAIARHGLEAYLQRENETAPAGRP